MNAVLSTAPVYSEHQVFMFCGHVEGHDTINLKSGYIVADNPESAIQEMHDYGFLITAISSLAEVRSTIQILEMIATKHPEVEKSEYLDLYPGNPEKYPEDKVFTFVGSYAGNDVVYKMGFVVASGIDFATEFLRSHQFEINSYTSLQSLREVEAYLQSISRGDTEDDDCGYINLKLNS